MTLNLLKRLETLICELMAPNELRRFIKHQFGNQISLQLPESATPELLAHGTVTVLERNGLIDRELFIQLEEERPARGAEIRAVAQALSTDVSSELAVVRRVRTPDYVVRDLYSSLQRQRTLLRELTHGELHLARLFGSLVREAEDEVMGLPERVVSWIDEHRQDFTVKLVNRPLEAVYVTASSYLAAPELGLFMTCFALSSGGEKILKQLYDFANLTDADLYDLTLRMIE